MAKIQYLFKEQIARREVLSAVNRCFSIQNKKADLSINMIIVAVLGLLILVVLAFVFSSKINIFGKGVSNCGGRCSSSFIENGQSGSELCDNIDSDKSKVYTYNPGGSCTGDTKEKKKACCIVAYTQ